MEMNERFISGKGDKLFIGTRMGFYQNIVFKDS
jgi:hypothetical protein